MLYNDSNETGDTRAFGVQEVGDGVDPEFELLWKDWKELKGIDKIRQNINQYEANTKRRRRRGCNDETLLCKSVDYSTSIKNKLTKRWDPKPIAEFILNIHYELIFAISMMALISVRIISIVLQRVDGTLRAYSQWDRSEGIERKDTHQEEEERIKKEKSTPRIKEYRDQET